MRLGLSESTLIIILKINRWPRSLERTEFEGHEHRTSSSMGVQLLPWEEPASSQVQTPSGHYSMNSRRTLGQRLSLANVR